MKKMLAVTGAILIACVILTSAASPNASAPRAASSGYRETAVDEGFTVTEREGRVAVLRGERLYKLTDTPAASLPKADRNRLSEGIHVDSEKELKAVLEDYCS